jgi:hypothetical protein
VYLQTRSIMASKYISNLPRSRPPSVSPSSLDYGLQVHLQTCSITACKEIFKERRRVNVDIGVTKLERVTGSIYSADPKVDRHHLISISSYHTMKIHTISFPTFGLTRSVCDIVGPRNCVVSPTPGSIISSHPIPTLLEPEPLFLMNSGWMLREVRRSVDGGFSAFLLYHFTATASEWCISKSSLNGRGCVLLRLYWSTICSQIDRMYL